MLIDYSQILKVKGFRGAKKHEYLEEVMRGLTCLAREMDVVICTAAQINRAGQQAALKSKGTENTVEYTDIGDAYAITRAPNPILTITKSPDDDLHKRLRVKLVKNRDGNVNVLTSCETDFDNCRIFADELVCKVMENEETDNTENDLNYLDKILKEDMSEK